MNGSVPRASDRFGAGAISRDPHRLLSVETGGRSVRPPLRTLHLAAAAPSPSNLEGLVYMRLEFVGIEVFLLTQPEMIAQCLLMALGIGFWACKS